MTLNYSPLSIIIKKIMLELRPSQWCQFWLFLHRILSQIHGLYPRGNHLPPPPIWWPRELPLIRCDRNFSMGTNIGNMEKILKFANNDGIVIIKADGGGDVWNPQLSLCFCCFDHCWVCFSCSGRLDFVFQFFFLWLRVWFLSVNRCEIYGFGSTLMRKESLRWRRLTLRLRLKLKSWILGRLG